VDPYITTGMIRTQCSLPLLTISPNPNQQLTADNGTVDSMRAPHGGYRHGLLTPTTLARGVRL
jgi:hypothetical protein